MNNSSKEETENTCINWFVYILRCKDNSLYTGITTNLMRRIDEHNNKKKGAKYTRSRRPVCLVYQEEYQSRSEASQREYKIKKLPLHKKSKLIMDTVEKSNSDEPISPCDTY